MVSSLSTTSQRNGRMTMDYREFTRKPSSTQYSVSVSQSIDDIISMSQDAAVGFCPIVSLPVSQKDSGQPQTQQRNSAEADPA